MRHALLFALLLLCREARAVVLDWSTVSWTAGSLSNSYDIDATNPGADITITISGDTGTLTGGTPVIDATLPGGTSPADSSLRTQIDLANHSQQITVTITFNYPSLVDNATFQIFDIGKNGSNSQDQIRSIIGTDGTTQYAATITNVGSAVQLAGSGTSQTLTGISSPPPGGAGAVQGDATVSFGTNKINQISYIYGSGSGANADPTAQQVTLFDISFASPVPECGVGPGALGVCLLMLLTERRRRPAQ